MTESVLIVDDSLTVRMDLCEAFDSAGFHPLEAASLGEARRLLGSQRVDAVILDVVLPDGDGIELLRELRASAEPGVPVLMLSTEAEIRDRIRGIKTGANEYVGKPYDAGYVIAKTRQLLHRRFGSSPPEQLILLIDDSQTFRAALRAALEAGGYSVITANTGEEGLRLASLESPSAIVVDGVLPGIDGATVIRRVRLDAALRGVPCLLLTADHAVGEELRALDSGADAFVHKTDDAALILAKLHAVLRAASESRDIDAPSLLGPKKLLAVDDSATYRDQVAQALRSEGYDVIPARSGEEALELLSVQPVDCILLDLMMPGMGGKETCKRLKSSPGFRDIPVVLLTSVDDRGSMLEGLALGADDYIEKAAEFEVLKARVRAQLRRRQFEDETRRVREQLLRSEIETAEARAARELAETRAALVEELERKNQALQAAYSELQATQAQLIQTAKMASLGELVAGVAHEINNPLAFVQSHFGTVRSALLKIQEESPSLAASDLFRRVNNRLSESALGLERIQELVVKLRTFSRLDEGELKEVSVRECVESVLTILGHRIKDRIRVETQFGHPDRIECFPSLLNQALMNLVANAVESIPEQGSVAISTGAEADSYVIRVVDSGPGIPEAIRDRVLEPFFTTKPVGQGTGLGLSITYSIIRKHGGTLELSDAAPAGTAAIVRLPIRQQAGS